MQTQVINWGVSVRNKKIVTEKKGDEHVQNPQAVKGQELAYRMQ